MNDAKLYNLILNMLKECEKEAMPIFMAKYGNQCKASLELAIEQFYDDYQPRIYKRQEGLLKAYRINKDGTYDFDSELITGHHRAGKEYLFSLAFMEGYHGGVKDGPEHPNPGTPYWRKPVPQYTEWGSPAVQTTPILDMVDEKIEIYNFDEKYEDIIADLMIKKMKASGVFK